MHFESTYLKYGLIIVRRVELMYKVAAFERIRVFLPTSRMQLINQVISLHYDPPNQTNEFSVLSTNFATVTTEPQVPSKASVALLFCRPRTTACWPLALPRQ